jgi:ABC-type dipeptide/oligopeptide/nickel transport system ATPase component
MIDVPIGCPFEARCPLAIDRCHEMPPLARHEHGREVACWRAFETAAIDRADGLEPVGR